MDSIFNDVCILVTVAFALTLVPGFRRLERSLQSRRDQGAALLVFLILGLQIGEPIMLVHGVTYLDDGRAIEAQESHFRGESMEFIIELGEHSQYARLMPHDLLRYQKSIAMKAVGSAGGP